MIITIFEQSISSVSQSKIYSRRFLNPTKYVSVNDLKFSTMYKVEVKNKYSDIDEKVKKIFIYTPA